MPSDRLREFLDLKDRVERLRERRDRAAGAKAQLEARLKTEHGVGSIKEAEQLLAKLEAEAEKDGAKYERRLASFVERWGELLDKYLQTQKELGLSLGVADDD